MTGKHLATLFHEDFTVKMKARRHFDGETLGTRAYEGFVRHFEDLFLTVHGIDHEQEHHPVR